MRLKRLADRGLLVKDRRGLYRLPGHSPSENDGLIQACEQVAGGVLCLMTALQYHGMTSQFPHEVWMAIDVWARKPRIAHPPMRFLRFSGKALKEGVEEHRMKSGTIRVTSAAKTVADCFKYRNKIGRDVALEALRAYRREKKGTMDALWRYAKVCRVSNVIRPYLESLA
jgi:predicted transcriptional regulator of viral defense system